MDDARPTISSSPLTAPFWEAARDGRLVVQRCSGCLTLRHYPTEFCPTCRSADHSWVDVPGAGTVYSFTESHRAFHPYWAQRVPYVIATVALDIGVRMVSDLETFGRPVSIGDRVEVFFETNGEQTLPRFRLSPTAG